MPKVDDKAADSGAAFTTDAALGGRLRLTQPARGHRFGHDAILLAAAAPVNVGDHVIDLGAGVGTAGLALMARVADIRVTLVEIDPALADLARQNAQANGFADRVRAVTLDVAATSRAYAAEGLDPGSAHHVIMNPPFNDAARRRASPDPARASAHGAEHATLGVWVKAASRLAAPGGTLTLIWQADGLGDVLAALSPGFGGVTVRPVYPRAEAPAIRVLVRAVKQSRAPLGLLPGLVLADADGRPTAAAEAVLRNAAGV